MNPKILGAHNGVGQVYIAQKDFQRAIAEYDALIAADPSSDNYVMRGKAYEDIGDHTKALADLSEAIRLKPDNIQALGSRYQIYGESTITRRKSPI